VGFVQAFLDEIGPVEAPEQARVLLKLLGLQQKKWAIFLQMPFRGLGHGYLAVKRQPYRAKFRAKWLAQVGAP
jgi:hypothetical protein